MHNISEHRKGEIMSFFGALVWSFFPIITIISYSNLTPLVSLLWVTFISFLVFLFTAVIRYSWVNILKEKIFIDLLLISLINGVGFYVLYFWGLKYTNAGNASIIAQFEILFSFLFFNVWKKESISGENTTGVILMFLGALIVLSPNFSKPNIGDFLILGAAMLGPIGNSFQQKIRKRINGEQILLFRTLFAIPMLLLILPLFKERFIFPDTIQSLSVVLISGIMIFGITKLLWIETIHRIPVTKAISLSSIAPFFTLIFAFLILGNKPTIWQLGAIIPITLGVYLLTKRKEAVKSLTSSVA